jgi:serine/threonine protein kinase
MKVQCRACQIEVEIPSGALSASCPSCRARIDLTAMETRARPRPPAEADAEFIGSVLGGYRLTAVIGRGGMGVVYEGEGEQAQPKRAAIKVLAAELSASEDFVSRFRREAEALTRLRHPNLIEVFGHGVHPTPSGPRYYFAMERFEGQDLRALLSQGAVSPAAAVAIIGGAAAGLEHAHAHGIVHRDVKPANILVAGDPAAGGAVKLVDFGVAHIAAGEYTLTSLTHSALILGTVNYMAPEQRVDAAAIDRRADVYALGVVAYELLTGRLPLGAFALPSRLARVSRGADRAILAALQQEPNARLSSAIELAQRLERALLGRRPPRWWFGAGAAAAAAGLLAGWLAMPDPPPAQVDLQTPPPLVVIDPPPPAEPPPPPVDPAMEALAERLGDAARAAAERADQAPAEPQLAPPEPDQKKRKVVRGKPKAASQAVPRSTTADLPSTKADPKLKALR